MAKLIRHFIGLTHGLGRSYLVAPLSSSRGSPDGREFGRTTETRALHFQSVLPRTRRVENGAGALNRPYTDLAYW